MDVKEAPNRIKELREGHNFSQQQLADACDPKTSQPQIDRLEKGSRKLTQAWLRRLSTGFQELGVQIESSDLLPKEGKKMVASTKQIDLPLRKEELFGQLWPRDLPVLGHARAGSDGFFFDNGEAVDMTGRPPLLANVRDAYAVYVPDGSMIPSLKPGHIAWVHPHRPPILGENVLVELRDGHAFLKEYVRRTDKFIICKQWNPISEVKYECENVKSVHLIVGSGLNS